MSSKDYKILNVKKNNEVQEIKCYLEEPLEPHFEIKIGGSICYATYGNNEELNSLLRCKVDGTEYFVFKNLLESKYGKIIKFKCSNTTTWILTENNDLYGCGRNDCYQQGNGNTNNVLEFTKSASNVKDFDCSDYTTWYIDLDNNLYGCGYNSNGQQGNNSTTDVKTFTKRAENVKEVICEHNITWYIDMNGDLYGCGWNHHGQQGNNSTTDVKTFTKRAENVKEVKISSGTWYLTNNNELYGCGYNGNGQQGNNSTTNILTFTKRAENVKDFYLLSNSTWYLTNDNELYGCGTINKVIKTFEKYFENVKEISGDISTLFYIDFNNILNNFYVYDGTNTQIQENVKKSKMFERGGGDVYWYLTNNGELYGYGSNNKGQQGSGDTVDVTTFTKRAENVKDFDCSVTTTWYITNDDEFYYCGNNEQGQQGNGTTENVLTFTKK